MCFKKEKTMTTIRMGAEIIKENHLDSCLPSTITQISLPLGRSSNWNLRKQCMSSTSKFMYMPDLAVAILVYLFTCPNP